MVFIPERATMSLVERPWAANLLMRLLRLEVGGGMLLLARVKLAVFESLLPSFTSQYGPPSCRATTSFSQSKWLQLFPLARPYNNQEWWTHAWSILTITTESLAVITKMSAQDTTPGHSFSTAAFIWSMTPNPLTELLLGVAVFSPLKVAVSSNSNDASQPYSKRACMSDTKY